ncbi:unnamed protein product [Amoebophrya sp. A120]|nr:unnamed protein product [Amoebophrya sp. A120]|eukprot:GSA120T00020005001.1
MVVATSPVAAAGESNEQILRIGKGKNTGFWATTVTNFLHGPSKPAKEGEEEKKKEIFEEVKISALGAAIPMAAAVVDMCEKRKVGTQVKVETHYTGLEKAHKPQILVTLKRNPEYVPPPPKPKGAKVVVPPMPERLSEEKLEKKMKKVLKEGGKRGVEIEGAADMGGLKYFCTKVEEPAGDLDMLVESVKAMNAKCDPSEEERKGGSGAIGKTVMSMAEGGALCIVCYVPAAELANNDAKDWLKKILFFCDVPSVELREDSTAHYAMVSVKEDGEKGIFPIKMRDYVIQNANKYLREKGLIPEVDDDSEEEMVFGDDDFP